MATYTSSLFVNTPKAHVSGLNAVQVSFSYGATANSAGDVIFLAKLPHGARIVEIIEDHSTGAATSAVNIGLATGGPGGSATLSAYISSAAQATVNRINVAGIPALVSVSDASGDRFGILAATVAAGTATTSFVVNVKAIYQTSDNS